MKEKTDVAEVVIIALVSILLMILFVEVAKSVLREEIQKENSRNPIIVFPPLDSVPILAPIYM
jgi:hypothetical protein